MTRTLYQCLLRLHPADFRRQFAGEMMLIFEEASAADGSGAMVADGVVSLVRQWVLRSAWWKVALAFLGALIQVGAGGGQRILFGFPQTSTHHAGTPLALNGEVSALLLLATGTVTGLLLMVLLLVYWVRKQNARRIRHLALPRR